MVINWIWNGKNYSASFDSFLKGNHFEKKMLGTVPDESKSIAVCLLVSSKVNGINQVSYFHFPHLPLLNEVKDNTMLKKWTFSIKDLVTFIKETFNQKLHFFCAMTVFIFQPFKRQHHKMVKHTQTITV